MYLCFPPSGFEFLLSLYTADAVPCPVLLSYPYPLLLIHFYFYFLFDFNRVISRTHPWNDTCITTSNSFHVWYGLVSVGWNLCGIVHHVLFCNTYSTFKCNTLEPQLNCKNSPQTCDTNKSLRSLFPLSTHTLHECITTLFVGFSIYPSIRPTHHHQHSKQGERPRGAKCPARGLAPFLVAMCGHKKEKKSTIPPNSHVSRQVPNLQ